MSNIVICGTPGTGKSTVINKIKEKLPDLNYINISEFAIDNDCIESYDKELETQVVDEDKLLEKLEPLLNKGVSIIECIHADFLPSNLVSWIFICRTNNTILYDRLKARNYNEAKISNNVEAEIFQTIHDEVVDAFDESLISQLINDSDDQLNKNVEIVIDRVEKIIK